MGFISFSLDYYAKELQKLESSVATEETVYHAMQLLKMLDDLLDEGYTELNKKMEEEYKKPENVQETTKRVNSLRNKIKDLGSINIDSIEEYKKVNRINTTNKINETIDNIDMVSNILKVLE